MRGGLAILLHAHLPYVRHAEHERFLEESWFYEALIECYLPLLEMFEGWIRDRINARITLVISPTLAAMLRDSLLQARFRRRLAQWTQLSESEVLRLRLEPALQRNAAMYRERFIRLGNLYERWEGKLIPALAHCQNAGVVELIPCGATHSVLPLWIRHPVSLRAQIETAVQRHTQLFGQPTRGFWLPECAYSPALEPLLKANGIQWFPLETHGLTRAEPCPRYAPYQPIITPEGLAVLGRDPVSAEQVWSREGGYPGDPQYRDFYRDIGFDLDLNYIEPYLPSPEKRGFTGLKYFRVTGGNQAKAPYSRAAALARTVEHAAHFVRQRGDQLHQLSLHTPNPPIILAPYDAELFGHWWFEGPDFLDAVARQSAAAGLRLLTPTDYLRAYPAHERATPSASSWGEEGYWRVWLNDSNAWIYPRLLSAADRLEKLWAASGKTDGLPGRILRLALQEAMLQQASDWPFIMRTGTHAPYARQRLETHGKRFESLADQLATGQYDLPTLEAWERQDLIFPNLLSRLAR